MPRPVVNRPGKMAQPLDPDVNPWDQQPNESQPAYEGFVGFRDSEDRKVASVSMPGPEASRRKRWAATYQWINRARAWDRYQQQQELDDLVRYRLSMNRQHRVQARVAQGKFVEWLQTRTPEDVARWRPMEAVRVWETAVRVERMAAGADMPDEVAFEGPVEAGENEGTMSLAEVFKSAPETEAALARAVHEALSGR